jgi:hypothetical protein
MKHVKVERYEPEVRTLKPGLFRLDPARVCFCYEKNHYGTQPAVHCFKDVRSMQQMPGD